ncbi:hypothetical protein [Nodosilinea sp. P-1105]|uniref:hypothetical protein n=1 Tax=Nodosilinea sp. P-1105 TaxID=2546229 RepID=UPI00146CFCF2|nr:hypothetical protein [Nodosilinea sp. P-1105]NMF86077.1 hypothetical protein [Nodosilinea sp. P-1105]
MADGAEGWYIVQAEDGTCQVLPAVKISREQLQAKLPMWGPYATQDDAIARRVGLIRAGKCNPV